MLSRLWSTDRGEEVFEGAVDVYFQEWKFKHPAPWDFFNTIERAAGRDLDWFWSSWYYETWQLDHAVRDALHQALERYAGDCLHASIGEGDSMLLVDDRVLTLIKAVKPHCYVPLNFAWLNGFLTDDTFCFIGVVVEGKGI